MSGSTATPVFQVTSAGPVVPSYAACLAWAQGQAQTIWGSDVYLGNDSPDGQLITLLATAIDDCNSACLAVYQSFQPAYAQGAGLSSVVKINNIARELSSNSTVNLLLIGTVGLVLTNATAYDGTYYWTLPATVVFPSSGSITVTATCTTPGAIQANPNTVNRIGTPTAGWNSVTNPSNAAPGAPVETDAQLRIRQASSVAIAAVGLMASMYGLLLALPGVTAVTPYENDTNLTDANGLPPYNIALIVEGGDAQQIANTIYTQKNLGTPTYGTTQEFVTDPITGATKPINFFLPTDVTITVQININVANYVGYSTSIGNEIVSAVMAFINAQPQGGESGGLKYTRLYVPAQLLGPYAAPLSPADGSTYELVSVLISRTGTAGLALLDVPIAFNEQATVIAANVTLSVAG
jgi:uncharacterized phage protein gp47/JayE